MTKTEIIIKYDCGKDETIDLADLDLDWEIVETDERELGAERLMRLSLSTSVLRVKAI